MKPARSPCSGPSTIMTTSLVCSQPWVTLGRSLLMDLVALVAFLLVVLARKGHRMLPMPPPCGGSGPASSGTSPMHTSTPPPCPRRDDDKNDIVGAGKPSCFICFCDFFSSRTPFRSATLSGLVNSEPSFWFVLSCLSCSASSRLGFARQRVRSHRDLLRVLEGGGERERERECVCVCVCVCYTHSARQLLDSGIVGKRGDKAGRDMTRLNAMRKKK